MRLNFSSWCSYHYSLSARRVVLKLSHGQKELSDLAETMIDLIALERHTYYGRQLKQFNSFRVVVWRWKLRVSSHTLIYVDAWWSILNPYSHSLCFPVSPQAKCAVGWIPKSECRFDFSLFISLSLPLFTSSWNMLKHFLGEHRRKKDCKSRAKKSK